MMLKSTWIISSLPHSRFCLVIYAPPQSGTRFEYEQPFVGEGALCDEIKTAARKTGSFLIPTEQLWSGWGEDRGP